MALRRSNNFNPEIDPELLRTLQAIAEGYEPYDVEFFSGYRPNPSRKYSQHGPLARGGHKGAIDFNLIDRKTGKALPNVRDPASAGAYQAFANKWYQSLTPEQQQEARWGGYFGDIKDWMHVDFGGSDRMSAGNWQGGFSPERMQELGLSSAGGLGEAAQQMAAAGYSPEQIRDALGYIESRGEKDPYKALGAWTGGNRGEERAADRAYGRYQVMGSNIGPWAEQYLKKAGVTPEMYLNDPALQDQLVDAVMGDYVKQYGLRGAASKFFTGSEKEPDRSDVHGKLTGKSYADMFMEQLMRGSAAQGEAPGGGPATPATNPTTPTAAADKDQPWWKKMLGGMGEGATDFGGGQTQKAPAGVAPNPAAAVAQMQPMSPIDPQNEEMKRQMLAKAMARLNAGSLWG